MTLLGGSYVSCIYKSPIYSPITWALVHLSYSINSGAARICQRGPKRGSKATERGEGVRGGFTPSHGREIFWKFVYENEISCTLNAIIRGLIMWSDYTNPLLSPSFALQSRGRGHASDGGVARICQQGPKRESEAGGGCGIFENLWMKTAFFCILDTITRGSLCTGIDQFPTLFLVSFFS